MRVCRLQRGFFVATTRVSKRQVTSSVGTPAWPYTSTWHHHDRSLHRYSGEVSWMTRSVGFDVVQNVDQLVATELGGLLGPSTFLLVLGAGLLTSFSPCTLSVLPLTIGYIGGYDDGGSEGSSLVVRSAAFAAGLATTLSALGLLSVSLGKAYGQVGGPWLALTVSGVAIAMGLSLLEVITIPLPSINIEIGSEWDVSKEVKAYLAGMTFALVASPCSTPVLATLLAYVSTTDDYSRGALLLFTYALGYVAPLMGAAIFTDSLKKIISVRQFTGWVTAASGVLLISGGTYGILSRLL